MLDPCWYAFVRRSRVHVCVYTVLCRLVTPISLEPVRAYKRWIAVFGLGYKVRIKMLDLHHSALEFCPSRVVMRVYTLLCAFFTFSFEREKACNWWIAVFWVDGTIWVPQWVRLPLGIQLTMHESAVVLVTTRAGQLMVELVAHQLSLVEFPICKRN